MIQALLKLIGTHKKASIVMGVLFLLLGSIGRLAYKNRHHIRTIYNLAQALMSPLSAISIPLSPRGQYLSETSPPWSMIKLNSIQDIRKQLGSRAEDKEGLWASIKVEVFTQLFYNLYASEVYKISFMVCACLNGRGQDSHMEVYERFLEGIKANTAFMDTVRAGVTIELSK